MAIKTIKTIKPITISFKNTPEDKELHEWVLSHSNQSGFIKDLLRKVKSEEGIEPKVSKVSRKEDNELLDLGDF